MANFTQKYNFKKPLGAENYNVDDQNSNWDKAEEVLKNIEEDIGSITVPVTSVNGKTGAVNLAAGDIKAADGKTLEIFKTEVASELAQKANKDGTLQENLNAEKLNGKTASAIPLTTNKTDIIGMVNELFTNASNIKSDWAGVIGSPLLATDTSAQLKSKTQTLKNTMATNLSAKGQTSVGTESLNSLINKIPNISTGKKWASGQIPVKTVPLGETLNNPISGLDFLPSVIVAVGGIYPATYTPMKSDQGVAGDSKPGIDMNIQSVYTGGFYIKYVNNGNTYTTKSNIIYWYAYE